MTRRSLYCSKDASGEFSVVHFAHPDGNVWHKKVEHSYDPEGQCSECKGSRETLEVTSTTTRPTASYTMQAAS